MCNHCAFDTEHLKIHVFFPYFTTVTRSQQRILNQHVLRECYVKIDRHLPMIAMSWLAQPAHEQLQQPNASHTSKTHKEMSAGPAGLSAALAPRRPRRSSVASCQNLYDVDGGILEVGFDRLNPFNQDNFNNLQLTASNTNKNSRKNNATSGDLDDVDGVSSNENCFYRFIFSRFELYKSNKSIQELLSLLFLYQTLNLN